MFRGKKERKPTRSEKERLRKKWVAALRSGDYEQGTDGFLRINSEFCCLGVLCDVIDPDGWNGGGNFGDSFADSDDVSMPSTVVRNMVGLSVSDANELATLNDREGADFEEIATVIENLPLDG